MAELDTPDVNGATADASFEATADWGADSIAHGTDPVPAAADLVAAEDPAPELTTEEPSEADREADGRFKKRNARSDPQARVEKATAREAAAKEDARLAREESARLKTELEAARKPVASVDTTTKATPAQTAGPTFAFPKRDAWLTEHPNGEWDDYDDAKLNARDQWRDQQQQDAGRWQTHRQRLEMAVQSDPALPALIQSGTQAIQTELQKVGLADLPDTIKVAILESDRGVDYYRYLLSHPAEAAQLAVEAKDAPVTAARLVRRYLDSVTVAAVPSPDSAPRVRTSTATAPISRVGGTASAIPANTDDLEFGPEYIQAENKRDRERAAAGRW